MEWIRVTAKTVADAITEATIQLGTSSDNIEYNVIEKGTAGFFGIGAKKAVIEAKKKKTDEDLMKEVFGEMEEKPKKEVRREPKKEVKEPKEQTEVKEAKKESRENRKDSREGRKENRRDSREVKKDAKEQNRDSRKERPVREPKEKTEVKEAAEVAGENQTAEVSESGKGGRRENQKRRDFSRNGQKNGKRSRDSWKDAEKNAANVPAEEAETVKESAASAEKVQEHTPKAPRVPADPEEAKRRAENFLSDLFKTMEMDVQMGFTFEDDILSVDINGDDMGILIGKRGQTLDSLQYLTSLVVNKGNASYVRVKLDTEDYRNRRKATLENLAKNIAMKVKKTRRPVFLEPMNPYERRIIHSALQNDPYVTTHSEGEEPCRKVVVTLRKNSERFEKNQNRASERNADKTSEN